MILALQYIKEEAKPRIKFEKPESLYWGENAENIDLKLDSLTQPPLVPRHLFYPLDMYLTELTIVLFICLVIFNLCCFTVTVKNKTPLSIQGIFSNTIKDIDSMLEDTNKKKGHIFIKLLMSPKWDCFFPAFLNWILPSWFATTKKCHSILTGYFCLAVAYAEHIFFHWTCCVFF